jgi:hypothetical protein
MASSSSGYTTATHDIEGQNDDKLDGLLGKVKILKDVRLRLPEHEGNIYESDNHWHRERGAG